MYKSGFAFIVGFLFLLVLVSCTPIPKTAVSPTPSPPTATLSPTETAVAFSLTPQNPQLDEPSVVPATPTPTEIVPTPLVVPTIGVATASLVPAPDITHPLQTDQVVLFARDNELWRSEAHGVLVEQLTMNSFMGWDQEEPDFRDVRPHLSPNGRYAAQFTSPNSTRIIDLGTGVEISIPAAEAMAWSPDSRMLAFGGQGLKIVDVVTNEITSLSNQDRIYNLAWSPDGTQLAYDCCFVERSPYDGFSDGTIRIIDLIAGFDNGVAETWLGVASGPPDFCWTENDEVTIEFDIWMRSCSLNFPLDDLQILSKDNVEALWEANLTDDGTWLSTRLFAINRATEELVWDRTFDFQSMPVMAWSPDGRFLFFDDQAPDSPIWRLTADGENVVEIVPSGQLLGMVGRWEAFISPLTVSPDGQWLITKQIGEQLPAAADETAQFPEGKYHVAMQVASTNNDLLWTAVDEWRPAGVESTYPEPLRWSDDGRFLFFTNVTLADGCGGYTNGSDLWRLDLSSGQLTEMTPFIGLSMDVSPDGTKLAVHGANGRGFLIRDLATGAEQSVALPDLGDVWALGRVLWSPDGQHILSTWVLDPCSPEQTTAVIRIDADTLTATTVVEPDPRNFVLLKWINGEVRLLDNEGRTWYLEPFSGELAGGFFGF